MSIQWASPSAISIPPVANLKSDITSIKRTSKTLALAAILLLSSCTTVDLSKFGESMTALSEASMTSQREIARSASDVASVLAYIEPSQDSAVCEPGGNANSPSACAKKLQLQEKELKHAFVLVQAYSNAIGNLSKTAGTGEESVRGICNSVIAAVNAISNQTKGSICEKSDELTENKSSVSSAGSLIDIGAALAGAFTSYQGNNALEDAMGQADPVVAIIAAKVSEAASIQESLVESLARVLQRDVEVTIDDYVSASEAIREARAFKRGSIATFVSDFLAVDDEDDANSMANNLSSYCLNAADIATLHEESHLIAPYLTNNLKGATSGQGECSGGLLLDVPVFLTSVSEVEAKRLKSLDTIESLLDQGEAKIQLEKIAHINQWKEEQLAQISAIPKIARAWRAAHIEALAYTRTCSKFIGFSNKKCGALTFENLRLLATALSIAVGGPYAMLPDVLDSI
ncbi:MAG: hypothetical protein WBS20_18040 [Lysobacterales bacterium]